MSQMGNKWTFHKVWTASALPPKADIRHRDRHVVPITDIWQWTRHVRF
jgi:hypothetical protein